MLNSGSPFAASNSVREMSWTAIGHSWINRSILPMRVPALSTTSSAQRGVKPHLATVNTRAWKKRKIVPVERAIDEDRLARQAGLSRLAP
jgi:hypothetical protein